MRRLWPLLTALLCAGTPALGQVTVDLRALDALPGARPAAPETQEPRPAPRYAPRQVGVVTPRKSPREQAVAEPLPTPPAPNPVAAQTSPPAQAAPPASASAQPTPPAATLPAAPPPVVALAPIAPPPPPAQAAPPPPPPVSDTANSAAVPTGNGLRVTFGSGQADLSPASETAIQSLVKAAPPGDGTSFNVVGYAAGTPEDPSTARRLSLSRALTVRNALMASGVGSSRIYIRALGAPTGEGPPDRVDLAVMGANASGQAQAGDKSVQQ